MPYPEDMLKAEADWVDIPEEKKREGTLLLFSTRRLLENVMDDRERLLDLLVACLMEAKLPKHIEQCVREELSKRGRL